MEFITDFISFFLHIDKHLDLLVQSYGMYVYVILFVIIFCETGLVITPVLPGDSLLFATGATIASASATTATTSGAAAGTSPLNPHYMALILIIAAILGDATNYLIGHLLGEKAFEKYPRIFRPAYLEKTRGFYKKYGGMTIIYARFVPIVRTFAPFLAGVGTMSYQKFAVFNIIGACLWISLFLYGGLFFGTIPAVKNNFTLVILGIILLSIVPPVLEIFRAKKS
jgi:membrane-associated protein